MFTNAAAAAVVHSSGSDALLGMTRAGCAPVLLIEGKSDHIFFKSFSLRHLMKCLAAGYPQSSLESQYTLHQFPC